MIKRISKEYTFKPVINGERLSELIKNGNYEKPLLKVLNNTEDPSLQKLIRNEKQAHGESDYHNPETNEKYEVKLAILPKDGELIGRENRESDYLVKWIYHCFSAANTARDYLKPSTHVEEDSFFKTLVTIQNKVKEDENAIIYIPFPIILTTKENTKEGYLKIDYLYAYYKALVKNQHFLGKERRKLFFVYPSIGNTMIVRNMTDNNTYFVYDDVLCSICGIEEAQSDEKDVENGEI